MILEPNTDIRKNREPLGQSLLADRDTSERVARTINHFKFNNLRRLAIRTIIRRILDPQHQVTATGSNTDIARDLEAWWGHLREKTALNLQADLQPLADTVTPMLRAIMG